MIRHASRFILCSCLCGLTLGVPTRAEETQPAPAAANGAPVAEPAGSPRSAPAVPAPAPHLIHPQVALAGFQREYRPIPIGEPQAAEKIRTAVVKPLDPSIKFRGLSLRAAASLIQDVHCVPVVLDMESLTDAGIDVDTCTIEQEAVGGSLGATLRFLLRPFGLTWTIVDEALTVTTKDKACERLMVVAYPLPRGFGENRPADFQSMIDMIQSTVAAASWDTVGGPGSIRPLGAGEDPLLVVSQTCEAHEEIEHLLRRVHDRLLAEFAGGRPVLRVHHVADGGARTSLAESLKDVCNASLTDGRDEQAAVSVIGDSVAVVSMSPEFHALAAQTIAAVAGVVEKAPPSGQYGMGMGGGGFCWVAREVYGAGDPRWLVFRGWMVDEAPGWLRDAYAAFGPDVAGWIRGRPAAKAGLRLLMDAIVEPRLADAGASQP